MPKAKNQDPKNSPKTTFRPVVLILAKEAYLFLRNFYGLLFHPFKTIVRIRKKPDWSQTILVLGLPVYLWLLATVLFLPVLFVLRNWYNTRIILLLFFYAFTLFLFLIACYLVYCLVQYYRKCKLKPKF